MLGITLELTLAPARRSSEAGSVRRRRAEQRESALRCRSAARLLAALKGPAVERAVTGAAVQVSRIVIRPIIVSPSDLMASTILVTEVIFYGEHLVLAKICAKGGAVACVVVNDE